MNVVVLKCSSKIQKIAKPISTSEPRQPTLNHMREVHTYKVVGSGNSEPLIPEILSRSALAGETSSKFR